MDVRDFDSLYDLLDYFTAEEKCGDYLAALRWNGKPECVYCGHDKVYTLNVKGRGKRYKCAKCRKQASVRVGTIFEESNIPLRKWFVAIYLITAHKKGISSHQLAKDIRVTQKTAWFINHRVREAYKPEAAKFTNPVEVDEVYIGGLEKNKHKDKRTKGTQGRNAKTKKPILGVIERGGKVYAVPVDDNKIKTIKPIISDRVEQGNKVFSDDNPSYKHLSRSGYEHDMVNHTADEYVRGEAHTNNIESFWALLKRGYHGTYHWWSGQHIGRYINEFTFRFNNRKFSDGSKFDILLSNCQGRLSYKQLTKKKA